MPADKERSDVAHMLRELRYDNIDEIFPRIGLTRKDGWLDFCRRIADYVEPDTTTDTTKTPELTTKCDRDTPQKVADEMFGKMRHSTKEEADVYDAMLKSKSVEIHPVDRDALLALADRMETMAGMGALLTADGLEMAAVSSIRKALGVVDGQEP